MTALRGTSPSASAGFTLIEVLMAVLIMTVGLLGLLQSLQVSYQHNARNKLREEAVQLAEEQMNEFRFLSFDNLTWNRNQGVERELLGARRPFQIMMNSENVAANSKKLMVAVAWQFRNETSHYVIYSIKNR